MATDSAKLFNEAPTSLMGFRLSAEPLEVCSLRTKMKKHDDLVFERVEEKKWKVRGDYDLAFVSSPEERKPIEEAGAVPIVDKPSTEAKPSKPSYSKSIEAPADIKSKRNNLSDIFGEELKAVALPSWNSIPQELKDIPQWVCWRYEARNGKSTKVPYMACAGRYKAKASDPSTGRSYQEAVNAYENAAGFYNGIGLILSDNLELVGIDLDHAINEEGQLSEFAKKTIAAIGSYAEISPSGKGIRIFVKGSFEGTGRKSTDSNGDREIYKCGRYLTTTGNVITIDGKTFDRLIENQAAIAEFHKTFPTDPDETKPSVEKPISFEVMPSAKLSEATDEDKELVNKMLSAKNGENIKKLYYGPLSSLDDRSAACAKLICHILWWNGKDLAQAERIINDSIYGTYDKWQRRPEWRKYTLRWADSRVKETRRITSNDAGDWSFAPSFDENLSGLNDAYFEGLTKEEGIPLPKLSDAESVDNILHLRNYIFEQACVPENIPYTAWNFDAALSVTETYLAAFIGKRVHITNAPGHIYANGGTLLLCATTSKGKTATQDFLHSDRYGFNKLMRQANMSKYMPYVLPNKDASLQSNCKAIREKYGLDYDTVQNSLPAQKTQGKKGKQPKLSMKHYKDILKERMPLRPEGAVISLNEGVGQWASLISYDNSNKTAKTLGTVMDLLDNAEETGTDSYQNPQPMIDNCVALVVNTQPHTLKENMDPFGEVFLNQAYTNRIIYSSLNNEYYDIQGANKITGRSLEIFDRLLLLCSVTSRTGSYIQANFSQSKKDLEALIDSFEFLDWVRKDESCNKLLEGAKTKLILQAKRLAVVMAVAESSTITPSNRKLGGWGDDDCVGHIECSSYIERALIRRCKQWTLFVHDMYKCPPDILSRTVDQVVNALTNVENKPLLTKEELATIVGVGHRKRDSLTAALHDLISKGQVVEVFNPYNSKAQGAKPTAYCHVSRSNQSKEKVTNV